MAVTHQGTGELGPIEYLLLAREAGKVVVAKGVEDKSKPIGFLANPHQSGQAISFRLNVGKDGVVTVDRYIRRRKATPANELTFKAEVIFTPEVIFTRANGFGEWDPGFTRTELDGHGIKTDQIMMALRTTKTKSKQTDTREYALYVLQAPLFEKLVLQHVEAWLQKAGA